MTPARMNHALILCINPNYNRFLYGDTMVPLTQTPGEVEKATVTKTTILATETPTIATMEEISTHR